MKKFILFIIMIVCTVSIACADNDKSFNKDGNVYSSVSKSKSSSTPVNTGFTWQDSNGVSYPIYISDSGSCYVIKTSKKTGKEYKNYLGPEISQDICNRLGREYKSKSKK